MLSGMISDVFQNINMGVSVIARTVEQSITPKAPRTDEQIILVTETAVHRMEFLPKNSGLPLYFTVNNLVLIFPIFLWPTHQKTRPFSILFRAMESCPYIVRRVGPLSVDYCFLGSLTCRNLFAAGVADYTSWLCWHLLLRNAFCNCTSFLHMISWWIAAMSQWDRSNSCWGRIALSFKIDDALERRIVKYRMHVTLCCQHDLNVRIHIFRNTNTFAIHYLICEIIKRKQNSIKNKNLNAMLYFVCWFANIWKHGE